MSNPGNIVGGHKANLNNPNTSDEAKQHSKEVLDQQFNGGDVDTSDQGKNPNNVAGGLKAAMHNPQVPEETKKDAESRLNQM